MTRVFKPHIFLLICVAFIGVTSGMYFAFGKEDADKNQVIGKPSTSRIIFAAPFENETGQEQYEPTAAGMGDLLAVMLAQNEQITVVERQQLAAVIAEQAISLKGLTARDYAIRLGKLIKADTVFTGRLLLFEGKLHVSVQALEIPTARVVAADQIACRPSYLVEAALQMARRLGEQMSLPLSEINLEELDKSPIASLHFAKALSYYYAGNVDAAIMQLMWTMDLDPDYTEANYWSGMSYYKLGDYAYAIIEWEQFLKREPESKYAEKAKELLAKAKVQQDQLPMRRFGPAEINKR